MSRISTDTQKKKSEVGFSLYLPVLQGMQERSWKTLHTWKKLCHPEIGSLPIWHLFPTTYFYRGPFTIRQVFENVINFPEQSRVACRILKILIWHCVKRDWKGVEAFHLKFNKVVARVGTAYPLCSPGISLHTYNLLESFHRLCLSQAHRWYNWEDKGKELRIVLETLPVQTPVSFPSCPPHDVMAIAYAWQLCPEHLRITTPGLHSPHMHPVSGMF